MPIRLIPNQLVKLYKTQDFNTTNKRRTQDYRTYCQLVREEQTTMFQVELLPDSENIITNGDFTDDISGWTEVVPEWQWASGRLQGEKGNVAPAQITQTLTITPNRTYRLTFDAQFGQASGTLIVVIVATTEPYSETVSFLASEFGTEEFSGEVFFNTADTEVTLAFILNGNIRDLIYIDDVTAYRLSAPVATLEDCNGNLIETLSTFAQSANVAVFAVEWFGKAEGCYRICLEDTEDTELNYLDRALALGTEGGAPISLEQGGYIKWFG